MKIGWVFLVLGISSAYAQQQVFTKKWDKRFGGTLNDNCPVFKQTKDNGFILGGFSNSGAGGDKTESSRGNYDCWVVKIDSLGNKQWDRRFGGSEVEHLYALQPTEDGGYILGAMSTSGNNGDKTQPGWGQEDYWIVKIDSVGNKQWDRRFGGALSDALYAIQQTKDKGYIFGGYSNSGISGDKTQSNWDSSYRFDDYWVVMVDSLGNKQWDKRFGGGGQEGLTAIQQTSNGSYILGGTANSGISGDKTQNTQGGDDYWIVRIDSSGTKEWDIRYGGDNGEFFNCIEPTIDGGWIMGGYSYSGISGDKTDLGNFWLVKIDEQGNKIWDKAYDGGGQGFFRSIYSTSDGGYLFTCDAGGNAGGDKSEDNLGVYQAWVVKIDSIGNKQWDKTIFTNGFDVYSVAIETHEGCYVVANSTNASIEGYVSEHNRDGIDSTTGDYWIMKFCWEPVGINVVNGNSNVLVYPNPFTADIAITLQKENLKEATFIISNLQGQVIFNRKETNLAPSYTKMLDLSYLPNGVYLVEVIIDGVRTIKKVIKE